MSKKKKKSSNPYASIRNEWTRSPAAQVLTNRRVYKRQDRKKAVRESHYDSLPFVFAEL